MENHTQNEEEGRLSNDSGELEPMEDAQGSACLGCEDAKVPLIEKPKETASLKETLEESEAPLSATSKDGALLTEAAEQNEAPLSEASKLGVLLTENLEQIEAGLSETYEGLRESHRATLLNVARLNGGSPTQTTMELSAARDGGQEKREIRDPDSEAKTSVNNAGNSSKGDVFSLVSDAVDVVTGEGDGMDRDACSEEENSQLNTTSPTSLLETVKTQTALLEAIETEEGDGIPMSESGSFGASPDTLTSVEVEKLGASDALDQNVKRNDKETLKTNKYKKYEKYANVQNNVNRSPSRKWRVQLKNYSPARTKSSEMKPKPQNRVSHTKIGDGEKDSSGTPAVSAMKTKKKTRGKKSGEKSVRWSDLTLPDCVQQYFNRSCTEIIPGAQPQDKVHFKCDKSSNSNGKPVCKNAERKGKAKKISSKIKNKPRKVKVAKDGDKDCEEEKVPSISAEEFIPAEAQHSNAPNNENRAENNVRPGKRQVAAPRGTSRETKRRKRAKLGSPKPETEMCSQRGDNRAASKDDEQIMSTGAVEKSTGLGSKEVS